MDAFKQIKDWLDKHPDTQVVFERCQSGDRLNSPPTGDYVIWVQFKPDDNGHCRPFVNVNDDNLFETLDGNIDALLCTANSGYEPIKDLIKKEI